MKKGAKHFVKIAFQKVKKAKEKVKKPRVSTFSIKNYIRYSEILGLKSKNQDFQRNYSALPSNFKNPYKIYKYPCCHQTPITKT